MRNIILLTIIGLTFGAQLGGSFMIGSRLTFASTGYLLTQATNTMQYISPAPPIDPVVVGKALMYPNPATQPTAIIAYSLTTATDINIIIYDLFGRRVKNININKFDEGARSYYNKATITLSDDSGTPFGNGIYIVYVLRRADNKLLAKTKLAVSR